MRSIKIDDYFKYAKLCDLQNFIQDDFIGQFLNNIVVILMSDNLKKKYLDGISI